MESVESQIAEWRAYVASAPGINGHDVDELEDHLRHQIAELNVAGLAADEAFLIAVKRLGDVDGLSREFAREHSGRLGNSSSSEAKRSRRAGPPAGSRCSSSPWPRPLSSRSPSCLAAGFPDEEPTWLFRNATLFVLPFLAAYFAHRRHLSPRGWVLALAPFAIFALVVNLFPYDVDSATEVLTCPMAVCAVARRRFPGAWAAPSSHTSGGWTSSASPASGSSTTC